MKDKVKDETMTAAKAVAYSLVALDVTERGLVGEETLKQRWLVEKADANRKAAKLLRRLEKMGYTVTAV